MKAQNQLWRLPGLVDRTCKTVVLLVLLAFATVAIGQVNKLPRVGWVLSGTPENTRHLVDAMRAGLADEGLIDGRSVVLDLRFLAGRMERYPEMFADLTREPVNVLAASAYLGISAARDASGGRIPVSAYFCGNDVKQMVDTFARPGGNITGVSCFSAELAVKRVELLKDAVPSLRHIGFLYDPRNPGKEKELADTREAAGKLGMTVTAATASTPEQLRDAIASLRRDRAEALVISEDGFTYSNRAQIVALAAENRLIDISAFREFVQAGGVLSYGASAAETMRNQARYAARMIQGIKPSELPILQPTRFELVVNAKAARALGLSISKLVLMRADDVIE
jgi:putative tryptophan/tyrosine transport system substrate-binding protein